LFQRIPDAGNPFAGFSKLTHETEFGFRILQKIYSFALALGPTGNPVIGRTASLSAVLLKPGSGRIPPQIA